VRADRQVVGRGRVSFKFISRRSKVSLGLGSVGSSLEIPVGCVPRCRASCMIAFSGKLANK